ncbi:MAG TPA: Calx-beta domain-containing protein, partial [Verrucomicrobiota bacterium]|nr:Calx-beta domain-containing protein [Verrucomicrobiota bacterium]
MDDETQEVDEYFEVDLFNVTGGGKLDNGVDVITQKIFLVDNDLKGGKAEFSADAGQVIENDGEISVAVRRVGGSRGQASVTYSTRSLTADSGEDYQPRQGVLTWAHQDVDEKWISIPIVDDDRIEEIETFEITLANPMNVIIGQRSLLVVSIEDEDDPGEVVVGDSDYYVNENGAELSVYVKRVGGTKGDVQVDYTLSDGTASSVGDFPDYIQSSGTLNFADGQSGQVVTLKILDDFANENTEFFNLTISNPDGGAILGSPVRAKVNIVDDETVNVPAGSMDTFFDTGIGIRVNGPVEVIKRDGENNLLLAGEFGVINGIIRSGIARLNSKGILDNEFDVQDGTNGLIKDILPLSDGSMIIVGDFTTVSGTARNRIAKINSDGYLNDSFDPGSAFDEIVYTIRQLSDGNLLVLGGYQNYKGRTRRGLVILDAGGNDVTPWGNDVGSAGAIYSAVQLADGSFVLGGDFEQFSNNALAQKVAKIDAKGVLDIEFTENFSSIYQGTKFRDGVISEVLGHPDGNLILTGNFKVNTATGRRYTNIIKVSSEGELVTGATPEDILAAEEARTAAELLDAQLVPLQSDLETAKLALNEAATALGGAQSNVEAATAALELANAALVLAEAKAGADGATQ